MAISIEVDLDKCQGMSLCALKAPEIFGIDEGDGKSVILRSNPDDEVAATRASSLCPTQAITVRRM